MRDISVFCEDSFHEKFVGAILRRFESEYAIPVNCRVLSSRGGLSQMHAEFKDFLRDLGREGLPSPDSVIVVVDANCLGYNERRRTMESVLEHHIHFQQLVSYAIPDPHIERWMLVDEGAFRAVFGRGCTTLPKIKCAKDEYKRLLVNEIRDSGIDPLLGGEEFAEEIVSAMDFGHAEVREASLGLFLKCLKALFNRWRGLA